MATNSKSEELDADVRIDAFCEATLAELVGSLGKQVKAELAKETFELRASYDNAVRQSKIHAEEEASKIIATIRSQLPPSEPRLDGAPELGVVAKEVLMLKAQLSDICHAKRHDLDGDHMLPFSNVTVVALNGIIDASKELQAFAEQCLTRLTHEVALRGLDGAEYPVQVRPCVDTVGMVIRRIRTEYDIQLSDIALSLDSGIVLQREELLMHHDLAAPITITFVNNLVANELLRLRFDDAESLAFESVSGKTCEIMNTASVQSVSDAGRHGALFEEKGSLILAAPVELAEQWTISLWTLARPKWLDGPYKVLLDGTTCESLIPLTILRGKLGLYKGGRPLWSSTIDLAKLAEGWHHLVAVFAYESEHSSIQKGSRGRRRSQTSGSTSSDSSSGSSSRSTIPNTSRISYYIDGERIGSLVSGMHGAVSTVGNSTSDRRSEAFGVISDIRIFGVAATDEQVKSLFELQ